MLINLCRLLLAIDKVSVIEKAIECLEKQIRDVAALQKEMGLLGKAILLLISLAETWLLRNGNGNSSSYQCFWDTKSCSPKICFRSYQKGCVHVPHWSLIVIRHQRFFENRTYLVVKEFHYMTTIEMEMWHSTFYLVFFVKRQISKQNYWFIRFRISLS